MLLKTETDDDSVILNVAIFSTSAVINAIRAFSLIFHLEYDSSVNVLLSQLEELQKQKVQSRAE
jgi:hypothetical protein